ncbi:MAG: cell division protein ZapA [Alphaproteobacteria bacterium]
MSQSVVTIRLNGTPYQIGCGAGEEEHVARLGSEVEDILQQLVSSVGQIGEARLLAMVALILADKASETGANETGASETGASGAAASESAAAAIDNDAAKRAEDIAADALESAAAKISALAATLSADSTPAS